MLGLIRTTYTYRTQRCLKLTLERLLETLYIINRKELEAKGDKNGTQISLSYDEIKKSKESGEEANTGRSAEGS
ncbi:MAG: hypothetical protein ACP5GS_08180 [Nitrososphaeria archaeon]